MRSETNGIACVWDWVEEIVGKGLHRLGSGEGPGTTQRHPAKTTILWENYISGLGGNQGNQATSWYEMGEQRR